MTGSPALTAVLAAAVLLMSSAPALADTISFRLLPTQSYATFKTDAPLETIVGHTAGTGIQGAVTVDPARPQDARGEVKVDMNAVRTGHEKRDADMRGKTYLDTESEANRWVTFQIKRVEVSGPLQPGKATPAKVHGILIVKQVPHDTVADATVTYVKLDPQQVEAQKRFGFTSDNLKVRAKMATAFTNHGMKVPELLFLKVSNDIELMTDLTFVRAQ